MGRNGAPGKNEYLRKTISRRLVEAKYYAMLPLLMKWT